MSYKLTAGVKMEHSHDCKRIDDDEMFKIANEFILKIDKIFENHFYKFKDDGYCVDDYLSSLLNIVIGVSEIFINQGKNAHPKVPTKSHIKILTTAIEDLLSDDSKEKTTLLDEPLH